MDSSIWYFATNYSNFNVFKDISAFLRNCPNHNLSWDLTDILLFTNVDLSNAHFVIILNLR